MFSKLDGLTRFLAPLLPAPKLEHHNARHEPTLIAAARSQMTASSPRGTFSQAELVGELVTHRIWV
jgi:hypothetical protein